MSVRLGFCIAVLAALPACWEDVSYPEMLVWADDDSEIALIQVSFEQRKSLDPLNGTTDKRDFRHQVFTRAVAGGELKPVGPERKGYSTARLYYMKSAGYLVTSHLVDAGVEWILMRLDGTSSVLGVEPTPGAGSCSMLEFLPSPDGSRIAKIARGASCDTTTLKVEFIDPSTLAGWASVTLPVGYWTDWTWTTDGKFVAVEESTDGPRGWRLDGGVAAPITVPACTSPKTTSSNASSTGRSLYLENGQITLGEPDPSLAFGCGL